MTEALDIWAAGGVLWRNSAQGIEIAVVHRPRYDDWSMPKGKLRPGEHPLLGACREVVEEAGMRPAVGRRLPTQEYWLGPDRKVVDYWSMAALDGAFTPNSEVDALRWMRPPIAATWLSYDRDRALLRAFLAIPPADSTVVLVRHGKAGERSAWTGDDRLRPLEPPGRRQAEQLRRALVWFGPDRVFSADLVRCVETVTPLADELSVAVETEPALTEEAYLEKPERALRRIRELAQSHSRSVVCSQGGVIPGLVRTIADEDDLPLGKVAARKGSVWALSFVDGRLVAADYYADLA
jgi:8-oxo-(d)GTP phosphatase